MTIVRTFELPEFDDYTIEDVQAGNNDHLARQRYYKDRKLVAELDIHYTLNSDDQPLKWPYKLIFRDINHIIKYSEEIVE